MNKCPMCGEDTFIVDMYVKKGLEVVDAYCERCHYGFVETTDSETGITERVTTHN